MSVPFHRCSFAGWWCGHVCIVGASPFSLLIFSLPLPLNLVSNVPLCTHTRLSMAPSLFLGRYVPSFGWWVSSVFMCVIITTCDTVIWTLHWKTRLTHEVYSHQLKNSNINFPPQMPQMMPYIPFLLLWNVIVTNKVYTCTTSYYDPQTKNVITCLVENGNWFLNIHAIFIGICLILFFSMFRRKTLLQISGWEGSLDFWLKLTLFDMHCLPK